MFLFKLTEVVQPQATPDHVQFTSDTCFILLYSFVASGILLILLLNLIKFDLRVTYIDDVADQHDYDTPVSHERAD